MFSSLSLLAGAAVSVGSDWSGISIERDNSFVSLGENSDVGLYRTAADELTIQAETMALEGGSLRLASIDSLVFGDNSSESPLASVADWHVFVGHEPIKVKRGVPVSQTFTTGAEYELRLDVKPYGTQPAWSNILHFTASGDNCCDYGDRIPAMWFYKDTSRMHIVAGTNNTGNANFNPTMELPMNEWTTVTLRVTHDTGDIFYNDTFMGSISTDQRIPHDEVQIWMSDDYHLPAKAWLRNVMYHRVAYHHSLFYNEWTEHDLKTTTEQRLEALEDNMEDMLELKDEVRSGSDSDWFTFVDDAPVTLKRGVPVTHQFTAAAEYVFSIDIYPMGTISGWNNIVHFTATGENCCDYGDRIPSMWFYKDSTRLHIVGGSNSTGNAAFNPELELPMFQWTTVTIDMQDDEGKIYYNDTYMGSISTDIRFPHDDVTVWLSDDWHAAANAQVRNVRYKRLAWQHSNAYNSITEHDFPESTLEKIEDINEYLEDKYWAKIEALVNEAKRDWRTFVGSQKVELKKGVPVTTTFTTTADYEFKFEIMPFAKVSGWNNIVHFTWSGDNCCNYGDRIPAMWFFSGSTRLHIVGGSNSSGNANFNPLEELPLDEWTSVKLRVVNDTGEIFYNEVYKGAIATDQRLPHDNVEVWMGDPWHKEPQAYMRNVMYEKVSYHHSNFYNEITEFDVETLLNSRERERERRRLDFTKGKTLVV